MLQEYDLAVPVYLGPIAVLVVQVLVGGVAYHDYYAYSFLPTIPYSVSYEVSSHLWVCRPNCSSTIECTAPRVSGEYYEDVCMYLLGELHQLFPSNSLDVPSIPVLYVELKDTYGLHPPGLVFTHEYHPCRGVGTGFPGYVTDYFSLIIDHSSYLMIILVVIAEKPYVLHIYSS